jgi:hypothetical protein
MAKPGSTDGRDANAAQPLGERLGTSSKADTVKTGKASQRKAGPDGGDSAAIGKTFKGT